MVLKGVLEEQPLLGKLLLWHPLISSFSNKFTF